jgi:MFS family permease
MYGNKLMVLIGFSWACLGSLLCGLSSYSHSDICFDVFRAFQGLGFSIALPNAAAVLARSSVDGQWRRVIYFTIFAASAPNGFLIGAIFASLIAQFHPEHWDFSFYLATVCLFGLTILAWATVPSDEYLTRFYREAEEEQLGEAAPPQEKPGFDWLGTLFALTGLILVNFAWNQAGVVGWSEPYNGVLLGVGLICIAIFLYVESKVAYPLIPVDIWTPQNSVVVGCIALGWSSFGIWNFYVSARMETQRKCIQSH